MSQRESDDTYHAVVAVLSERWRVIDSRQAYPYRQWILQRRLSLNKPNTWAGESYWQTREGVLRSIREKVGPDIGEETHRALSSLPDRDMGKKP